MKIKTCILLAVLPVLFLHNIVYAEELISFLPNLLNEHDLIRAAEQQRDRAAALLRAAKGDYYPTVDVTGDVGQEWVDKVEGESTDLTRNSIKVSANQLITDFGATAGKFNQAEITLDIETENLRGVRQNILLDGIVSYLGLIRSQKVLEFAQQAEESIRTQTGMEETMVKYGAGLSSDVLQAKSQLSSARANVANSKAEFYYADNRFKAVYGYSAKNMVSTFQVPDLPEDIMPASLEEAIEHAKQHNPRLQVAQKEIIRIEQDLIQARSRYYPQFSAFAEAGRREDYLGSEGVRNEVVIGAELVYNLFNGGTDVATVKAASSQLMAVRRNFAYTTTLVEEEISNAWQELLTSRDRFKNLKDQADIVGRFLEFARKERKAGKRSLLDVLAGEADYLGAQSNAAAAMMDIYVATYRVFYTMGELNIDLFVK